MLENGNGTVEQEKTPEQLKRERFETNPEEFYHQSDIILGAVKHNESIAIVTGAVPRSQIEIALTRLTFKVFSMFQMLEMQKIASEIENESKIVTPQKGGIMNFVRGRK